MEQIKREFKVFNNTMYIDHQHKLVQVKVDEPLTPELVNSIKESIQMYIDDGYKYILLNDTFSLRVETEK